ncbi:BMP family ABC transporter substrate-binding protein [Streptomyces hokutonensis]|uniref:BMP family ABC transporter substrate-binding protein n=1 Tax=Streptomyces hokutonensis TaxID=1306990 RepID=UPI0037FA27D7
MGTRVIGKSGKRLLVSAALTSILAATGCGTNTENTAHAADSKINVAVIYSGPKETPYAQVQINGVKKAIAALGPDKFTFKVVDGLPFTKQLTQTAEQLFQTGTDVIVDAATAGPLFYEACAKYPKKHCLEGYPVGEMPTNTAGYWVDSNTMFYLQGVAAGLLTKSGTTGFVNAIKLPGSTALVNSFALGCRSVRPDCEVRNVYLNSFSDPPGEVSATKTLVNGGADVIAHYMDDPATLKAAASLKAWSFGLYTDQRAEAPGTYVTSQIWQPALTEIFKQELTKLVDGKWKSGQINWGTASGTVNLSLGPWGKNVPASVRDKVEKVYAEIKGGTNPFTGPIRDAKGKVRVPAGKQLDPRDPDDVVYANWSWPVAGVIGG